MDCNLNTRGYRGTEEDSSKAFCQGELAEKTKIRLCNGHNTVRARVEKKIHGDSMDNRKETPSPKK